jgi:hypothetical protein
MDLIPINEKEVEIIDRKIRMTQFRINKTEDEIRALMKLNEGRRKTLRHLGRKRAETLTFRLFP